MTEQPRPAAPAAPDAAPTASPPAVPAPTPTLAAPAAPNAAPAAPAPAAPAASNAAPAAPAPALTATQTNVLAEPRRSHRASGAARQVRERLDGNEILISLALLGEATKAHLLAFHIPGSPIRRIERSISP